MTDQIFILTCVPVELHPTLPEEATYSTYKVVNCPECNRPMWLGEQGEKQVAHGAMMLCVFCTAALMRKHGVVDITAITLTGPGKA